MAKLTDLEILQKVKLVCETHRNPDHGDNQRRSAKGKVCNSCCKPSDVGATRTDQTLTRQMYDLVGEGLLFEPYPRFDFPYFRLTPKGEEMLAASK